MRIRLISMLLSVTLVLASVDITVFAAEQGTENVAVIETQETEESGEEKEGAQEEQSSSADEGESEGTSDFSDEEIIKDTDLTEETLQTDIETETNKTETDETETDETETYEIETNETETETAIEEDIEALYETVQEEYEELMVELAVSENTYKITENQLFMQAPQYLLKDNPHDEYLTRCFNYTRQAMDDVSTAQTWWAAFMKGLKDGSEFLTKEIASSCGLTGSNYDKQKKDLAGELLREYMGNEEYLGSSAQKLSKQLKGLDKIADADLKIQKEEYKKQLKDAFTSMTNGDIDKAVDTVFGKLDKITGYADKAVDAFDIITSIMANQELQLEIIDDLMVSLQDSRDGDLYDGLILIRNDVTSDIGTYILENYLTDKAIGKIKGVLSDAIYDAVSGILGTEITVSGKVIVGIAVNAGVCCYEHFNPSVDDIVHTTIMYNYALTLDNTVLKYKMNFYNKKAGEEDIERFKAAYSAELCAVKLMMEYAKKLTSKKALKNTLDSYRESIGKTPVTGTDYINRYRLIATKDIDAGLLTVTDESATQKTPDGTVIDEKYDPTESIKAKYVEIQKKYPPDVSQTWKGSYGGAIQCFGFARMVFNLLFGCDMPSAYQGSKRYEYVNNNNVTVIGQLSGSDVTADNMKKLVTKGKLGDVTQGYGVPYGQHTMILQEVKDTGAVFYQCNYLNEDCLIYTQFYTWESLANRYGEGDSTSGNGFTLYRANNYGTIYGDGSDLFYDDSVNFVINDGLLVKYNGWQSHVEIPDTVTAIGDNAFKNNTTMMTVNIPDSVTSVGNSAFYGCTNLVAVLIPDSVESIGNQAFYGCTNLASVQLSYNVTSIGYWAFRDCDGLKRIEIPKSLERTTYQYSFDEYTGGIFYDCDSLKTIIFEEGITEIVNSLFANCNGIEEIEIPDTVTNIEKYAFYNCANLRDVKISNSVTNIKERAFGNCSNLTNLKMSDRIVSIGYWAFRDCDKLEKVEIPKSLERTTYQYSFDEYTGGIFYDCDSLKTIIFEEGITKIVNSLFANCNGIEEIEVPDTVTNIEKYAFYNCANLRDVKISNSVTNIKEHAFGNCSNLTYLKMSDRIVSIGYWAFRDCDKLEKVEIPKSLERTTYQYSFDEYTGGIFYDCDSLKTIIFEEGITKIVNSLFANCNGIEEIEIPDTVTNIEKYAFYNCTYLKKVTIPTGVETINEYVFTNDSSLLDISIPDTVTSMGNYMFSGCSSLKTAKLPNIRVNISEGMFRNCTSLTTINIPKTVTTIKQYAFQSSGLTELTLPENVTTIEGYAFDGCTDLAKVTLDSKLQTIGSYAFRNNDALTEITIPNNVTMIGTYAFQDSDALTSAVISNSVISIGQYIFEHCDSLKDVILGTGLTKIPSYAFNLCPALEKIVLPYRIATVESNAFTNCTKLTEITIPRGTTSISTNAFSYPDRLTIYGISGTYAETYANQIEANFVNREINASEVTLNTTELSMIKGAKYTLIFNVTPSDFTDVVTWQSSNTDIITVDDAGVITAKAVGTANVRVTIGDKMATCTVTVVQPVTSISINKSSLSLDAFEEYTLTATVYPSNAADSSVEWTTSDESVAIVSQTGKVTPISKGTAVITVTAKDGSGKYGTCNVTVTSDGERCTKYSQLESDHNYADNTNKIWMYRYDGAKTLDVTFDAQTAIDEYGDFIYIYDGEGKEIKKATGTELAGQTIRITGDTMKIKLVSDNAVTSWGFKVSKLAVDGTALNPEDETPEEKPEDPSDEPSTEQPSEEPTTEPEQPSEEPTTEPSTEQPSEEPTTEPEQPSEEPTDTENQGDGLWVSGVSKSGYPYTGDAVKPALKVYNKTTLLTEKTDYTISYKNNTKAGKATITVTGKGNYSGKETVTFDILPIDIGNKEVHAMDFYVKIGKKAQKPVPELYYMGTKLKNNNDFTISYANTSNVYAQTGEYSATITGKGNYTGTRTLKLMAVEKIVKPKPVSITKATLNGFNKTFTYTGKACMQECTLTIKNPEGEKLLTEGTDYTIQYANNIKAGTATVTYYGKNGYTGKLKKTYKILPYNIQDDYNSKIKYENNFNCVYAKGGSKPKPVVTFDGKALEEGIDYTLSYKNNKAVLGNQQPCVVVNGKGCFKGKIPINFTIISQDLSKMTLVSGDKVYKSKANNYSITPKLMDLDGKLLSAGKDFDQKSITYVYEDDVVLENGISKKAGSSVEKTDVIPVDTQIHITLNCGNGGNYIGTFTGIYRIVKADIKSAKVTIPKQIYTGNEITLDKSQITVKLSGVTLKPEDYEIIQYADNVKKGKASVTIKGKDNYGGVKTVKFTIGAKGFLWWWRK